MSYAGVTDMAGLLSLNTKQIIKAQSDLSEREGRVGTPLGPVIDGSVLPEPPLHAIAKRSAANVDFLTGTNLNEVRFWLITVPLLLSLIHISEPTRLGMISYAVFCLKKKKK